MILVLKMGPFKGAMDSPHLLQAPAEVVVGFPKNAKEGMITGHFPPDERYPDGSELVMVFQRGIIAQAQPLTYEYNYIGMREVPIEKKQ